MFSPERFNSLNTSELSNKRLFSPQNQNRTKNMTADRTTRSASKRKQKQKLNELPIYSLLQTFKLQQYVKLLIELGFGYEVLDLS